jgi:hypothetical protein
MASAARQVANWLEQAPPPNSRWPGSAVRNSKGDIDFRKGRVIAVSDLSITVEMDHPLYKIVKLLGESYAHYCRNCTRTIPGNVTYRRSAGSVEWNGQNIPIRFFCPWCGPDHLLRMLVVGDWLKLHYRFAEDRSSAAWFGEIWEW